MLQRLYQWCVAGSEGVVIPLVRWHLFFSRRKSFGSGHEQSFDWSAIESLSTVLCLDTFQMNNTFLAQYQCTDSIVVTKKYVWCYKLRIDSYNTPIKFYWSYFIAREQFYRCLVHVLMCKRLFKNAACLQKGKGFSVFYLGLFGTRKLAVENLAICTEY